MCYTQAKYQITTGYTQLFLTHIDEQGHSTPPVLLDWLTAPDRAVNIPEFVNAKPSAIKKIKEKFLNDYSFVRAGNEFFKAGEADNAIEEYNNALELNPNNVEAHLKLGFLFYNVKGDPREGMAHYEKAMKLDPKDPRIHHDFGMALLYQKKYELAIKHLSMALQGMPQGIDKQYNAVDMHYNLGMTLFYTGKIKESAVHLSKAVDLDPNNAQLHYKLAVALAAQGMIDETLSHYSTAIALNSDVDRSPTLHDLLGINYAREGRFHKAILSAEKAVELAHAVGNEELAQEIMQRIELYRQNKPYHSPLR